MPGLNHTGPLGQGPMTGNKQGKCYKNFVGNVNNTFRRHGKVDVEGLSFEPLHQAHDHGQHGEHKCCGKRKNH